MNKTKLSLYIIILLFISLALFGFIKFSDGLFQINDANNIKKDANQLIEDVNKEDYAIFWIGNVPERLSSSSLNIRTIGLHSINEQYLPFEVYTETQVIELEDGHHEYKKTLKNGYCPTNSYIVINGVTDLTSDDYSLIMRCLNEGDITLYIFGKDAVNAYRQYMMLPAGDYYSMKVTSTSGNDSGFLDELKGVDMNTIDWMSTFLTEILNVANSKKNL